MRVLQEVEMKGKSLADAIAPDIGGDAADACQDAWRMTEIDVPADGSCFFHSIAMAMDECLEAWHDIEELRVPMERYWQAYTNSTDNNDSRVTSSLIRFMCAENIDQDMLDKYNAEAQYRKHTLKERGVVVYTSMREFREHVLKPHTWADHASFNAFLKSLNFRCGLVVFDTECGGISYLPPQWTRRKLLYIFLLRRRNHYSVLRIEKGGQGLDLCVCYRHTKELVDWIAATGAAKVLSEF